MFSNEADRKKFMGNVKEMSDSMYRMEAERDLIREIVKAASDEFKIPKKTINKIAKTYHKQNLTQVIAEQDEFVEIYEATIKPAPADTQP